MSDPNQTPQPAIDLSSYVPKTEVESMKSEYSKTTEGLKKSLEDMRLQLLDPSYLDYLEDRKKGKSAPAPVDTGDLTEAEINSLRPHQLLKLAEKRASAAVLNQLQGTIDKQFKAVNSQMSNIAAYLELMEVKEQYPDFDQYKDDVKTILDKSQTELTISQAYLMAKGEKAPSKAVPENPPKGGERPGGRLPLISEEGPEKFKNEAEAIAATEKQFREKYGIKGETL